MNAEQEYAGLINDIDRELTNLKTAHLRPLGTLNFYTDRLIFPVDLDQYGVATFNVIVKITTPTVTPPIVQVGWNVPEDFYTVTFLSSTTNGNYDTWTYNLELQAPTTPITSAVMDFSAISSQPIESITWEYA